MKAKTSKETDKVSMDFLIEEYSLLREYVQNTTALRDGRLNFFLATISGAFVGIGLINQAQINKEITDFISAGIIIGIFLVGLVNFSNIMNNNFQITKHQRGLNRIKHYFIMQDKSIEPFLIYPPYDDIPSFTTRFPTLTAVINCVLGSIGIPLFIHSVFAISTLWLYTSGVSAFLLIYFIQYRYFVSKAKKEERLFKVQFSSKSKLPPP